MFLRLPFRGLRVQNMTRLHPVFWKQEESSMMWRQNVQLRTQVFLGEKILEPWAWTYVCVVQAGLVKGCIVSIV
jgi:hypothetical protein